MSADDSEFEVPPGFGLRLRALRERRGLRQVDVALLMGKGRSQALVSQLESGRLKNPTLGLVIEYLRAVRARFSEISDLLDKLTAELPSGEKTAEAAVELVGAEFGAGACRAAVRYDRKVALRRVGSGRRPEPVAKRVERGRRLAQAYARRRRVERRLWQQMTRGNLGVEPGLVLCVALVNYGMALWAVLRRRGGLSRSEQRKVAAEVEARTGIRLAAPGKAVDSVRESIFRLLKQPEEDTQPTAGD